MAAVVTARKANISTTKSLFQTVGGACGACLLLRVPNPPSHHYKSCPMISPGESRDLGLMRSQISYVEPFNGACFKCHLPSGGDDQWHPSFGSAPCPHPNLVWPMVYIIWAREEHRNKVRDALNITESWETSHDFLQWFTKGVNKKEPNGYRVVKWILQSELKLL